jgi:hypothetical protein
MGAGLTNTTSLNDLIGSVVAAEAQGAAYATRIMRPLVKSKQLPVGFGSVTIPRFGKITVAALTQATAPTIEQMTTDGVVLTPVERGALVRIAKTALRADPFSDLEPYGKEMGRALAEDEDALILAKMIPATIINEQTSSSNDVTLDDFLAGISALETQNAPGPFFAVWHPTSWGKLRKELSDAAVYAAVGRTVVEGFLPGFPSLNGYVGSPFGIPCFLSTSIDGSKDTAATWSNVLFSQEAVGYGYGQDLGIDVDDNIPCRAFDLMGWYTGHAEELVDLYSVCIEDKK